MPAPGQDAAGHATAPADETPTRGGYRILQLAVPCPLYRLFDYRVPASHRHTEIPPGARVRVSFGRQSVIAIVIAETDQTTVPADRLKEFEQLLDSSSLLGPEIFRLLQWAARYYNHPPGEVFHTALPVSLRSRDDAEPERVVSWRLREGGLALQQSLQQQDAIVPAALKRAPRQQQLLKILGEHVGGLQPQQLNELCVNWRAPMRALEEKQLVERFTSPAVLIAQAQQDSRPALNTEQQQVVADFDSVVSKTSNTHSVHAIDGITGSGKTEIYLELCERHVRRGEQVLVMVPEIGLTPQLTQRFLDGLDTTVAILHSGMGDSQRYAAWHAAAQGEARVVIGTRSSVFTPMPALGLIIIDEEHDASFKQQDGFRYNARDLAIVRASQGGYPVLLGSATPSLETLHNVRKGRYIEHHLRRRANRRPLPRLQLINLCSQKLSEGFAEGMLDNIGRHLDDDGQVLLFINRRGFAPLLMCHECGWTTRCQRCDANMTYHRGQQRLHCHHCGAQRRVPTHCDDCGSADIVAIGAGTERIEQYLQARFPDTDIIRIDRDTTRRRGSLEQHLARAREGGRSILVGTQMLAKGHDFPNITLVGILDTDQALFSTDFRATENLAQLIVQVAGRAGRAERSGEVLIQTHHPEHPLLQQLLAHGYEGFADAALQEREAASLPPYSHLAILRCESVDAASAISFLDACSQLCRDHGPNDRTDELDIFGPVPAPMERRAGRFRYQLMLQASSRKPLQILLNWWLPQLGSLAGARKVRWSIDVDPYDTY